MSSPSDFDAQASRFVSLLNGLPPSPGALDGSANGRPYVDQDTAPTTIYVDSAAGNDAFGDGTASSPYATLQKAFAVAPQSPNAPRTIQCVGAGPYNFGGRAVSDLYFLTIKGEDPVVVDTRTITSIGASSAANGIVVDDADTAMTVDQHRGKMVRFTSGPLDGQYGVIHSNAANQVSILNGLQGTSYTLPAVGNTYDILDWVTEMDFPEGNDYILSSCGACTVQNFRFTGLSKFLFCNDTDKLDFQRCRFEIDGILTGRGGSMFLSTCSVANRGSTFSDWGMVTSITQGMLMLRNGTLIDTERTTSDSRRFISALTNGTIETHGEVGFRGMGTKGITIRGSGVVRLSARLGSLFNIWRFISCSRGVRINNSEGWGWAAADLPDLYGSISGNYAVEATGGARVRLGSNSNITTGTSPNAVSADNGATAVARHVDGTIVVGGAPDYQEYTPGTPGNWSATAPTTIAEALDRLAAASPGA